MGIVLSPQFSAQDLGTDLPLTLVLQKRIQVPNNISFKPLSRSHLLEGYLEGHRYTLLWIIVEPLSKGVMTREFDRHKALFALPVAEAKIKKVIKSFLLCAY